jgi:hypothetical protein
MHLKKGIASTYRKMSKKVRITFVRAGSIGLLSLFILQIHEASYLFLKSITLLRTLLRSSVRTKYIQEMPLTPPRYRAKRESSPVCFVGSQEDERSVGEKEGRPAPSNHHHRFEGTKSTLHPLPVLPSYDSTLSRSYSSEPAFWTGMRGWPAPTL